MLRDLLHKGFGYLDIITEYPVVADLQRTDTGLFLFSSLDGKNGAFTAVHQIPQAIYFGVGALADDTAFTNSQRGLVSNSVLNGIGKVGKSINAVCQLLQQGSFQMAKLLPHCRQSPQTVGKTQKIPAVDCAGDDTGHDPLQVGNAL